MLHYAQISFLDENLFECLVFACIHFCFNPKNLL